MEKVTIEEIANFCKKKGFIFRSSDIYGGFSGFWDFGPLGVELFNNIKQDWWNYFIHQRQDMVGIDASIISHPKVWKTSGHVDNFFDIAVVCKKCKKSTKIDASGEGKAKCECGGEYKTLGKFNQLFKTSVGALTSENAYLRGETAQGMFINFRMIYDTGRVKLPFGIAQIGKCFRNEIAPRNFIFRCREFTIGEFEFFIHPEEKTCNLMDKEHLQTSLKLLDAETQGKGKESLRETDIKSMLKEKRLDEWHAYWLSEQMNWLYSIGLNKIKVREHVKDELSHYSSATFDIDYEFPFGSQEVAGNANRGQYDLTQHTKASQKNLDVFDELSGTKVLPRVIEPTFGMDRVFLAIIVNGYIYNKKRENIVLKIPAKLSPIKLAVFPLVKSDEKLIKISREIFDNLKKYWNISYDESSSVGRRYARNDEIGTPMCVTIDSQTLEDNTVTIRDRDTTKQVRVNINNLKEVVEKVIEGANLLEFGGEIITRVK